MSKMPKFDWIRIAMSLKSPTFSRCFWTLLTRRPHAIQAFWILGTCKTYCNHISIWTWHNTSPHHFVKIILDHGRQTSTQFFQKPINQKYFLDTLFLVIYISKIFKELKIIDWSRGKTNDLCLVVWIIETNIFVFIEYYHSRL